MAHIENYIKKFPECANCSVVAAAKKEMAREQPGETIMLNHCKWHVWGFPVAYAELSGAQVETRRMPFLRQPKEFIAPMIIIDQIGSCDHVAAEITQKILRFLHLA